jgi:hypothetical protein
MAPSYLLSLLFVTLSFFMAASFAYESQPLPPSQDPFYRPPPGYELTPPGTILRLRTAAGNLTTVTGNCSVAYNILYRTTDSNYQPAWAVTTLFMPTTLNSTNHTSLLSYQIPYNSASVDGSASYLLYGGGYPDIGVALGQHWAVNVPDFEGPQASFGLGLSEGHAVLDSIRAVQSDPSSPLIKSQRHGIRTALWGYSGGSIASLWALELQAGYSSDLVLHGAAVGGLIVNITADIPHFDGSSYAGLVPSILLGFTSQSPTARAALISQLKPCNASTFLSTLNMSFAQAFAAFEYQDISSYYFINGVDAALALPEIKYVLDNNGYSGYHGIPQVPMFVYKSIADELAPVEYTDELVQDVYCPVGVDIRYERNSVGGHLAEYYNGVGRARDFLTWVLDGIDEGEEVPVGSGCTVVNVAVGDDTSPI